MRRDSPPSAVRGAKPRRVLACLHAQTESKRIALSGTAGVAVATFVSLQRKKRIFGFTGILAPATTTTTITITSSILPSHQIANAQLTSSGREGKLLKCKRARGA